MKKQLAPDNDSRSERSWEGERVRGDRVQRERECDGPREFPS